GQPQAEPWTPPGRRPVKAGTPTGATTTLQTSYPFFRRSDAPTIHLYYNTKLYIYSESIGTSVSCQPASSLIQSVVPSQSTSFFSPGLTSLPLGFFLPHLQFRE